jgi:tRNA(Ile)-lysidine synthase
MLPFGATTSKKLQDLFTDAKVPRTRRYELPILLAGEQIIWVPTVRRAAFGTIHDKTQATITISFKENT